MLDLTKSAALLNAASLCIPGGVNSPVRAFKAVGGTPPFMKSAKGAYLHDEDGNRYIDLINSWGPMLLGHAHPAIEEAVIEAVRHGLSFGTPTKGEKEIAELIVSMVPSVEKVRMVNSGTEATMSAVRLARGFTGRDKFIKLEGCYHGHGDSFLIAGGSGMLTLGQPNSPGVTKGTAQDTVIAPYNDLQAVEALFDANPGSIAALILEPVAGNIGCIVPKDGYLAGLRKLCDKHGALLIFDEVMTGFRLAKGGAQELYGITPDLTTLGKIIGGGMPVGAYGGRKEIMDYVSPLGPVYQAGTLSGNPVAMAAGLAMLRTLNDNPEIYASLEAKTDKIENALRAGSEAVGKKYTVNRVGSMLNMFFTEEAVYDYRTACFSDLGLFKKYFHEMLAKGVYLAPSQFETLFVCNALSDSDIAHIGQAHKESLQAIL